MKLAIVTLIVLLVIAGTLGQALKALFDCLAFCVLTVYNVMTFAVEGAYAVYDMIK